MDQYQRISFVIAVISGAGFLAYVAADDIFLSFAHTHWREDKLCGKGAPSPHRATEEAICNPAGCFKFTSLELLFTCSIRF